MLHKCAVRCDVMGNFEKKNSFWGEPNKALAVVREGASRQAISSSGDDTPATHGIELACVVFRSKRRSKARSYESVRARKNFSTRGM